MMAAKATQKNEDKNQDAFKARQAARLAAVQALYEIDLTGADPHDVVREYAKGRWPVLTQGGFDNDEGEDAAIALPGEPDQAFLEDIVIGASEERVMIDDLIQGNLSRDRKLESLEAVLRALLRAAVYELFTRKDVPPHASINVYVEIARAYFDEGMPGFVNGVIDKIAHIVRAEEMQSAGERKGKETGRGKQQKAE